MVLLEMSIVPLGVGSSVSRYVAECLDIVDASGLDYELHSMGTIVEGELPAVLALMQQCVDHLALSHDRVTVTAKLDYRAGHSGRITKKVESVKKLMTKPQ